MAPTLAVVSLLRNESEKLRLTLPVWSEFADGIIALDDNSTDDTFELLKAAGADVSRSPHEKAWGQEWKPRALLFDKARASKFDYLFWLDGDMIPGRDPSPLIANGFTDLVNFRLYDLWDAVSFRHDSFWIGHMCPRPWLIRNPGKDFEPKWTERGIHCGHLPLNLPVSRQIYAPTDYSLLHYAYSTPEFRDRKLAQYRAVSDGLTGREKMHAESIGDANPWLSPLPFIPQWSLDFSSAPALA